MAFSVSSLFFVILIFTGNAFFTAANLHQTKSTLNSIPFSAIQSNNETSPSLFFEVTKPIDSPKVAPCSINVLHHDFGFTYGAPPVSANYTPPSHCGSGRFSKIVMEWKATCKGRQFDRIFGVWLNGVELLRSCTAEPTTNGIVWTVRKDVTKYSSLLLKNETQLLDVYLANIVDQTYTGVYHVDLAFHFYPDDEISTHVKSDSVSCVPGYDTNADLILPVSRSHPLNDGLWFAIQNSTHMEVQDIMIPRNVYRAVLEVYVSFHERDEFWYGNLPNDYIAANNITGLNGNGPFREVVVSLDDEVIGAIWPFTVVYTGGINPLLWRPITGIGSFDLPTYDIQITPFLGTLLDGKQHKLGFSVTNALNVWYIDANLHLWLDSKNKKVKGKVLRQSSTSSRESSMADSKGLDGKFLTKSSRSVSSVGWVKSSHGKIITHSIQSLGYTNTMVVANDTNFQSIDQLIHFDDKVFAKKSILCSIEVKSFKRFPFYLYSDATDQGNGTYLSAANITFGFNEKKYKSSGSKYSVKNLENKQNGHSVMEVKNNLVTSGIAKTRQVYKYEDLDSCYLRNVSSLNYTIRYDQVENTCSESKKSDLRFWLGRWPISLV